MTTATRSPRRARKPGYTPQDLLCMEDGARFELVDGQLEELEMGTKANWIALQFAVAFLHHVALAGGVALPMECGLQIYGPSDPGRIRKPDAAFLRAGRLAGLPDGYVTIPPDIVVEVVSTHDIAWKVEEKVREYLAAGVQLVWVAYPPTRTVHAFRSDGTSDVFDETGTLSGGDAAPGLAIPVAAIFPAEA